ncbi:MAG: SDR family NAD(P)-dependent oxidoreductase [Novosphingobium sp.]|nr:SDR family NAD(P)-dependent oxidoreductase [Novosphingobium sp.]
MSGSLAGRRALITGSSSGIGAETARWLGRAGASIVLHGRNADKVAAMEEELRAKGVEVASVIGSLDDPDAARAVASEALQIGQIDILVNNAGGSASGGGNAQWFEASAEEWDTTFRANVLSTVAMTHEIVPAMKERGWGRVIQNASAIADNPISTIPDYKAAKTAVVSFTISLAIALRGTGVTSNAVSPGLTVTENLRGWIESLGAEHGWGTTWEEIEKNAAEQMFPALVARTGRPEDIARAILFFAEPGADFITGQHLRVDGGMALA